MNLELRRTQVREACPEQVIDILMDKDSIVGVSIWPLTALVPERRLDDPAVHNAEEVVQNLGMQLETRLVKAICTDIVQGEVAGKAIPNNCAVATCKVWQA